MYLRERLEVKEHFYPFAEKINSYLYDIISSLPYEDRLERKIQSQGLVRWIKNNKMRIENKKLNLIENWISQMVYKDFVVNKRGALFCYEMWGLIYEDESEVEVHSHPDALYSCSYYVNAPKGSAPLIFTTSNRKIKAEEGKLIAFDGRLDHHVPKSKINDNKKRCVIVCNYTGVDMSN
tara:strand:+ start:255 stop:791 length:537 start_codon:yes stop_codon:yes gene_type:complete